MPRPGGKGSDNQITFLPRLNSPCHEYFLTTGRDPAGEKDVPRNVYILPKCIFLCKEPGFSINNTFTLHGALYFVCRTHSLAAATIFLRKRHFRHFLNQLASLLAYDVPQRLPKRCLPVRGIAIRGTTAPRGGGHDAGPGTGFRPRPNCPKTRASVSQDVPNVLCRRPITLFRSTRACHRNIQPISPLWWSAA